MRRVFKYGLMKRCSVPVGFIPLHAERDPRGDASVWCEVDDEASKISVLFEPFGTGHSIPPDATFCATYKDGVFMWHVYWRPL